MLSRCSAVPPGSHIAVDSYSLTKDVRVPYPFLRRCYDDFHWHSMSGGSIVQSSPENDQPRVGTRRATAQLFSGVDGCRPGEVGRPTSHALNRGFTAGELEAGVLKLLADSLPRGDGVVGALCRWAAVLPPGQARNEAAKQRVTFITPAAQ